MRNCVRRSLVGLSVVNLLVACSSAEHESDMVGSSWATLMDDGAASSSTFPSASATSGASTNRYCDDCSTTPLAWWKFDFCNVQSTELADAATSTPFQHPAFRAVSVACVAGAEGQAVQLAGGNDIVYSPDQPDYDFSQGLTVAAWVRPDSVIRTQSLVRKRLDGTSAFTLAIENGRVAFAVRLTTRRLVGISAPIQAGRFTHVAVSYDGQRLRLYVDGELAAQADVVGRLAAGVGPIFVGNDASGRQFKGTIDEVWVNTVAAPPETIKGLTCIHLPPEISITPNTTPPTAPNTPIAFDISITNPADPQSCPVSTYLVVPTLEAPLITDNWYTEIAVPPGQTAHITANVSAADTGYTGPAAVYFAAYDEGNYSLNATAQATFVVASPSPPAG